MSTIKPQFKYKFSHFSGISFPISKVEFISETKAFILLKGSNGYRGRRVAKNSSYEVYFDTLDQAKEYAIQLANSKILACERDHAQAMKSLAILEQQFINTVL